MRRLPLYLLTLCLFASAAQPALARTVTVRIWGTGGFGLPRKDAVDPFSRANRAVVEDFEHKHHEIRLEVVSGLDISGPANESGLTLAMAGGMSPDVIYVNLRKIETYVEQGFLYPLDTFIAENPRVMDKVHAQIRDAVTVNGHTYCYPFQQAVQALYYRKDMFRDAGLDPSHPPANWDEFYECCKRLYRPELGQYGFGFDTAPQSTSYWWVNFLWSAGGDVVKQLPDGKWVSAFNTPEGARALLYYKRLVADEWTAPNGKRQRGVVLRTPDLMRDFVRRGKLAMWFQYQTDVIANQSTGDINASLVGIAPMPKGPGGLTGNEINAYMYGVSALQKDPAVRRAAWEFVKYMGSDEADAVRTKAYVEAGLGNMISVASLKKHGYDEFVTAQGVQWAAALEKLFTTGKPEPHGKNCEMIYTELDQPLVEIGLYPDRDPMSVLNRAAAKIDSKLLGYTPPNVMARRRRYAFGAVTGIFIAAIVAALWALRRLASGAAGDTGPRPAGTKSWRSHITPWLFMSPAVASILLWAYFPLVRGLVMAFQDYKIVRPPAWIGLDNFIEAATQDTFWLGIRNSFAYVGLSLGLGFGLPILLAILLSEVPRGKYLFRTLFYLPAVTSGLVIIFLWRQFYDPTEQGLFNRLFSPVAWLLNAVHLANIHLPLAIDWLGNPSFAMLAVVLPAIWAGAGPGAIIYLAALKTISEDVYEAADIDGASIWQKIRQITLPSLRPLIVINLVGAFIGSFKAMENIFVMTGGGPLGATHTIGLEIWYNAFMYLKFGYATAAAWIMGAMLVGFTLYQLRILRNVRFTAGG